LLKNEEDEKGYESYSGAALKKTNKRMCGTEQLCCRQCNISMGLDESSDSSVSDSSGESWLLLSISKSPLLI